MEQLIEYLKGNPNVVIAFAAICALLTSFVSIILTLFTLFIQRRHNYKSLTPIASIPVSDYENKLEVKVGNTGVGPLIVNNFKAFNKEDCKGNIISFMPNSPPSIFWETFYEDLDGLCIPQNQSVSLIKLSGDFDDKEFVKFRDEVRKALSDLSIKVTYKDVYGRDMPAKERDLSWFGRQLD